MTGLLDWIRELVRALISAARWYLTSPPAGKCWAPDA